MMDALQLLRQQHGKARAAFKAIVAAPVPRRTILWARLRPDLELHEKLEEAHVYAPIAREVQGDRSLADWESAHLHDVHGAEALMREIDGLDPSDDRWLTAVAKLQEALEEHIRKEEQEMWPRIGQVWDAARLDKAGRQMATVLYHGSGDPR